MTKYKVGNSKYNERRKGMKKQLLSVLAIGIFSLSILTGCINVTNNEKITYIVGDLTLGGSERLKTEAKVVSLRFTFNSKPWIINYTVYKGINDYLASLPREIEYYDSIPPTTKDFIMSDINQTEQREFLLPLVTSIEKITQNKDDQARIAISIVQNIPYDWVGVNTSHLTSKYPYEVLYTTKGVCGEKSNLLIFLLRELGFGVVAFEFEHENHRAVGVKSPFEYCYNGTGYCFVETASLTIITDSEENYVKVGKLTSCSIITISTGLSFEGVSEEYKDAKEYIRLNKLSVASGGTLSQEDYNKWCEIVTKYGIANCQPNAVISN